MKLLKYHQPAHQSAQNFMLISDMHRFIRCDKIDHPNNHIYREFPRAILLFPTARHKVKKKLFFDFGSVYGALVKSYEKFVGSERGLFIVKHSLLNNICSRFSNLVARPDLMRKTAQTKMTECLLSHFN